MGVCERYSTTFIKDVSTIKNFASVTKADICREFLQTIPNRYLKPYHCGELTEIRVSIRSLYDLIEKMEQEK